MSDPSTTDPDLAYIANALGVLPSDLVPWLLREFSGAQVPELPTGISTVTATALRRQTNCVLRDVGDGIRLILTFHGRPIAVIAPFRP
jgi:prevent-host-death family protein